jgi:hypothetical protein
MSYLKYGLAGFFGYGLAAFPFVAFPALILVFLIVGAVKLREHAKKNAKVSLADQLAAEEAAVQRCYPNRTNALGTAKSGDWSIVIAVINSHAGVSWYKDDILDDEIFDYDDNTFRNDRIFIDVILYGEQAETVKACHEELTKFFAVREQEFAELDNIKQAQLIGQYKDVMKS